MTACSDISKSCDENGVCKEIAEEDRNTLEPLLLKDIAPDDQVSSETMVQNS